MTRAFFPPSQCLARATAQAERDFWRRASFAAQKKHVSGLGYIVREGDIELAKFNYQQQSEANQRGVRKWEPSRRDSGDPQIVAARIFKATLFSRLEPFLLLLRIWARIWFADSSLVAVITEPRQTKVLKMTLLLDGQKIVYLCENMTKATLR